LIGPTVARFGERITLIAGLVFGVLGFTVFGIAETGIVFLAGIPLLALWGFANPAALGLMSHQVDATEQGRLQGANASIMGIANLLGPGLFAQTLAFSISGGGGHWSGAAFLLAAAMVALAIVIAWRATARGPAKPLN